jgi:hypothetical protein
VVLERQWQDGDTVEFSGAFSLKIVELGGRTAFTYGLLTLARDEEKEGGADLEAEVTLQLQNGQPVYALAQPEKAYNELLRIYVNRKDGGQLLLTDFASCGKKWLSKHNRMTVWQNIRLG